MDATHTPLYHSFNFAMMDYIDPRVILALAVLAVGSYMDIKRREVNDLLWIIAVGLGVIIHILYPLPLLEHIHVIAVGVVTAAGIAYIAYRLGLFGGADMLALISILVILPIHERSSIVPALSMLLNACILAVVSLLYNIIRNAISIARGIDIFKGFNEPLVRKIIAFIVAQRVDKVGVHYAFIAERNTRNGKRFDLSLKHAEYSSYADVSSDGTWVMVGLPFIVYMLLGLIAMLAVGDIFQYI